VEIILNKLFWAHCCSASSWVFNSTATDSCFCNSTKHAHCPCVLLMTRVCEKLEWRFSTFETRTTKTLVLLSTNKDISECRSYCMDDKKRIPYYYPSVFKVFGRVSRWSFRMSIPFSLLCLILLMHFHKNASFHPNMLNYLNTTFTFGKQTKDNFINRKVHCRPTHPFIYSYSCPHFLYTSQSTAISYSSAGSTPRQNQARSEM